MPRLLPPLLLALAIAVAGCREEPAPPPRPPVQLVLTAPRDTDTTGEATVLVSGNVTPPNARVIVLGEAATVSGGAFSTSVDLREGPNIIDVGASAAGRRAVWRALRVTRRSTIRVPDVLGREEEDAQTVLTRLGLSVSVTNDDDLIDAFRGGPRVVCSMAPEAGAQLKPGDEIEIVVSRTC